jgi:hypothetical protein
MLCSPLFSGRLAQKPPAGCTLAKFITTRIPALKASTKILGSFDIRRDLLLGRRARIKKFLQERKDS